MRPYLYSTAIAGMFLVTSAMAQDADTTCQPDLTLAQAAYGITAHTNDHHAIHTEIVINAAPAHVWQLLTEPENVPNDWSSSYKGLKGDIRDGGQVNVAWQMKNGNLTDFPLVLKNFKDGVQFGWSEEFPNAKGIFDNHLYRVEAISECQTRFIQSDKFKGTSAENPDVKTATFAEQMLPGYVNFNRELKAKAEAEGNAFSLINAASASKKITEEAAKKLVQPFFDLFSLKGSREAMEAVVSADWKDYHSETEYQTLDDVLRVVNERMAKNIPDLNWELKDIYVTDQNEIIVRGEGSGTPIGATFMRHDIKTGNSFKIMSIDIHQVENGVIVKSYHVEDFRRAIDQLKE